MNESSLRKSRSDQVLTITVVFIASEIVLMFLRDVKEKNMRFCVYLVFSRSVYSFFFNFTSSFDLFGCIFFEILQLLALFQFFLFWVRIVTRLSTFGPDFTSRNTKKIFLQGSRQKTVLRIQKQGSFFVVQNLRVTHRWAISNYKPDFQQQSFQQNVY